MDETFFEAIAHAPSSPLNRLLGYSSHRVLGRRLRPLSVWHEALLDCIDSPFAQKPRRIQPRDREEILRALFLATEICRLTHPQIPAYETFFARRRRKLAVRRFFLNSNRVELLHEQLKFHAYLADYRSAPVHAPKSDSGTVQSPHWLYLVELFRRFHPEVKLDRVWNMSPGELAWYNTAAQEASGVAVEIMTENRARAHLRAEQKTREQEARNAATANK